MIEINIQEQKEWLKSHLDVVLLTSNAANKQKIQNFNADKSGKALEAYLTNAAWIQHSDIDD